MVTEDSNPKKLYSFINGKRCERSGVSVLKKDNVSYSGPKIKSIILNDQFSSFFMDEDFTNLLSTPGRPFPKMTAFTISSNGVLKLLRNLNPHKAQGPDDITSRFLKECAEEIAPALTLVYEASIQQGTVPED